MKWIVIGAVVLSWIGCKDDKSGGYPVLYTLHHMDQSAEGHYLVETSGNITGLPTSIGSFGAYKESLKQSVLDGLKIIFDVREIELLNEDSLRIHMFIDEEEFDLTLGYERTDETIVIDSLESGLILYEKADDQFVVCGVTSFAFPGPNVTDPGSAYDFYSVSDCIPGYVTEDYALAMFDEFPYVAGDTLGVFLTAFIYR